MAKKRVKRQKPAKKTELTKRDKPEDSEILTTITRKGKKLNVLRRDITKICVPPVCIAGPEVLDEDYKLIFELKFEAIRAALSSSSKDLQDEAIGTILNDLVIGAYQDKLIAYATTLTDENKYNTDATDRMQKHRQAVDTHLLNIIKAVRDIKRPPVSVVVKEAQQVNVAEQINQADKQVNIAKNQQS